MLHNLQRSEKSQSNDKVKSTKVRGLHFTKEHTTYNKINECLKSSTDQYLNLMAAKYN